MKSAIAAVGVLMATSACAPAPESIAPKYVSEVRYRSYSCERLGEEQAWLNQALASASIQQSTARRNDVMGVILVKMPVGSLSGQAVTPLISLYKGQLEAVHRASISNSCQETTRIQTTPPPVGSTGTQEPAWLPVRE